MGGIWGAAKRKEEEVTIKKSILHFFCFLYCNTYINCVGGFPAGFKPTI